MKILFLIPARGGSKGLPNKNIKLLSGKPMIAYTILEALKCTNSEHICISTDDYKIQEIAESYGISIPFTRPAELATDTATSEDVILHAIDYFERQGLIYDFVLLLQPTSPLRRSTHIKKAISLINQGTEAIISVSEAKANPYYLLFNENKEGFLTKFVEGQFTRRQDCPIVWEINGAIYIFSIKKLKEKGLSSLKIKKFVMDRISSVDIDDELDFKIADCLLKNNSNE